MALSPLCPHAGRRTDLLLLLFRTGCHVTACRQRARLPVINSAGCTRFDRTGRAVSRIKGEEEEDASHKQLAINTTAGAVRHLHLLH